MPVQTQQIATPASVAGLIVAGTLALAAHAFAETRMWVDDQGREVRAAFAGLADGGQSVSLKLDNGDTIPFAIARLSGDCQAYAREMAEVKAARAAEPQYNFDSDWPQLVGFRDDPEIEIIREDADAGEFIYESLNFRYVSDARLSRSVVRGFALLFESTHEFCQAMPLGMGEGVRTDGKYLIKLYEEREDYIKAGAPARSAGVFMGSRNLIKVPFGSLGLRPVGSGYMLDRSVSNRTLSHEIAHQLTPLVYRGGSTYNAWFIEGIAEYVATTPYRSGQYNTRNSRRAAAEYATGFSRVDNRGRNIGTDINLPSLKAYMDLTYQEFTGSNANFNYGVGLLLTYYFIHMDGEGDAANLRAYLRAILDGKTREEAEAELLAGRTFKELQNDLQAGWRRFGVRFNFAE